MTLPFLGAFRLYGGRLRWPVLAMAVTGSWFLPTRPLAAAFTIIAALLLLCFFRCPGCTPTHRNDLASPATGLIDVLEKVEDIPHCGGSGTKIGIFLSVFDVHVTRAPVSGRIIEKRYTPGRHSNAMSPNAGDRNQRNDILIETENGKAFFLRQISGAIARRVVFDPEPGDLIRTGAIVGMIRFGSRVEIFVPDNSGFEIRSRIGDRVLAGTTIIGIGLSTLTQSLSNDIKPN
jgi:phosphatidylserine decarboxylase